MALETFTKPTPRVVVRTSGRRCSSYKRVVCSASGNRSQQTGAGNGHQGDAENIHRRIVLAASVAVPALTFLTGSNEAIAEEVSASKYVDDVDKFSLAVPADWIFGEGEAAGGKGFSGATGARRTVAFFPSSSGTTASDANISVVVTNVGADFTKLGSFGTPYDFGTNLVNSMDRSFMMRAAWKPSTRPVITARLLDAEARRGMYFVDYNLKKPEEEEKRILSLVALGFNGTYNRLYTLTLQCPDKEFAGYEKVFDAVLKSFQAPKPFA